MRAVSAAILAQEAEDSPAQFRPESRRLEREILYTRLLMYFGIATSVLAGIGLGKIVAFRFQVSRPALALADAFFAVNIALLMYGSLFYQLTRLAYLKRLRTHRPATRDELEKLYDRKDPHSLAIIIPSYREELNVVRQTLMSAALTEYPGRRVVLLIDDPPSPSDPGHARNLAETRRLARDTDLMLRAQAERFAAELREFDARRARGVIQLSREGHRLAQLYREAARWLETQAVAAENQNHYDELYAERILREPARAHRGRAREIERWPHSANPALAQEQIAREYRRLAALFSAPITTFERKRFVNLSHAPNKAMNLNSYLALIGRNFREVIRSGGLFLEECDRDIAQVNIADADYIITLDADSLLLSDYALRLTHVMDQPESARYAVVESPFTAVPGSPSLLERLAGAQTDVQWIGSQGSTYYNASFWVGANALLRRAALEDICEIVVERGFPIRRYIQDHTLVEDTESTIDLVIRGWQIYCYPERLSYSATPPDFGALLIQRRRWANGPLLIVPKLLKYALRGPDRLKKLPESVLRLYTLTSATGAIAMLLMIALRFPDAKLLPIVWLLLAAIPYYILYCRDLIDCGYEWWDLPRMYALNLLLIPANLAGLLKSLYQAVTGHQSAFVRTPKVPGRTAVPPLHVLIPVLIFACIIDSTLRAFADGGWAYAAYGVVNAVCLGYGITWYVGLDVAWKDVALGFGLRGGEAAEAVMVPLPHPKQAAVSEG
ncbi:MAG: glycosyltransferase family 2 protein [Candidatus Binataceae bacterium]